ncbi:MAG: alpha-amylase family glycosyl hydrolase [Bacilli bacterium]
MNVKDLIFYEIYPTSFFDSNNDGIGDLNGIIQKLDYIQDLGFNALWINPFFLSPFKDGGYDIKDFYEVDPKFGNLTDLNNLIKEVHHRKMKIIIDLVAGHASEENEEFLLSALDEKNFYSDLFIWNNSTWEMEPNYKLISGRHERFGNYLVNFFSFQPAFNYGFNRIEYPSWQMSYKDERTFKAREYMLNVMHFYLKLGVDGFRVDMADSLVKNDDEKTATIEVWNYLFSFIRKEFKDAIFVSEWCNPYQSFKAGFDIDFLLAGHRHFFTSLTRHFHDEEDILNGGNLSYFVNNMKELLSFAKKENKYLGLISGNHDTERLASSHDINELKIIYLLLFTLPGIPFVYYGDEIEMKHAYIKSKDGGYQRTGDRTPMQWDNSKNGGFSKTDGDLYLPAFLVDHTNVIDKSKEENSLFNTIKELISIRKNYPSLTSFDFDIKEENRIITISRNELEIVINLSNEDKQIDKEMIYNLSKDNILHIKSGAIYRK